MMRKTLAIIILMLSGCVQQASQSGQTQLNIGRDQYEKKHYSSAIHSLSEFLKNERGSREVAYALYLRGLCYRGMGPKEDKQAVKDLEKAIRISDNEVVQRHAHIALGHIYFEKQQPVYEKSVWHYKNALPGMEDVPPKDDVLYRLGVALQGLGQWKDADLYFSQCFNTFKLSKYAAAARNRFGAQAFRLQVGAFSSLQSAKKLVGELGRRGWQGDWSGKEKNGKLLYIVQVGKYNTYKEAGEALSRLLAIYPKAMMVTAPLPKQ